MPIHYRPSRQGTPSAAINANRQRVPGSFTGRPRAVLPIADVPRLRSGAPASGMPIALT